MAIIHATAQSRNQTPTVEVEILPSTRSKTKCVTLEIFIREEDSADTYQLPFTNNNEEFTIYFEQSAMQSLPVVVVDENPLAVEPARRADDDSRNARTLGEDNNQFGFPPCPSLNSPSHVELYGETGDIVATTPACVSNAAVNTAIHDFASNEAGAKTAALLDEEPSQVFETRGKGSALRGVA